MLKYDYTIERKIGQGKIQNFVPNLIPTTLSNLVSIEGPNSSGKSTLLNIVALGLFGTKNQKINLLLRSKLNSLIDSNHQKLKFSFEIKSQTDNLSLRSIKNDLEANDIIVEESVDGKPYKPLSFETFEKRYNLIYDIPNNPTERLSELLNELKEDQNQYGNKFKDFGFYLRKIIAQITTSRDTKRLEFVKNQLKEKYEDRKKINEETPKQQNLLNSLEKAVYLRYYYYYTNESQRLAQEKERLLGKIKKFGEDGKKITTKLKQAKTKYSSLQGYFRTRYNEVTPLIEGTLPKKEHSRFKIWKGINPYQLDTDDLNNTKIEALFFSNLFGDELNKIQQQNSYKEASLLERILNSLEQYEHSGLLLPKLSVTLGDFVKILREEYEKSSIIVKKYQTLSRILELLSALTTDIDQIKEARKEMEQESTAGEKMAETATETYYGERAELTTIDDALQKAIGKCSTYYERCCSIGFDENALSKPYSEHIKKIPMTEELQQYMAFSENDTMSKIAELKHIMTRKNAELQALNIFIGNYEKEQQTIENQEPHKYEACNAQLIELLQITETMSQKLLNEHNNYLKNLILKNVKEDEIEKSEEKKRYYYEVSKYLGFRVGLFRHIDTIYRARIVDLVTGKIITEDKTIIYIADMGTGQSQSAYLLSLLNVKNDNRKIIALFDEIAMMDENSLEPICSKLKELYKNNKLILGILVQKGNALSVNSFE